RGDTIEPLERQLDGKAKTVRHGLRPAAKLILARQPVARRVQLDRVEVLRVEAEELGRLQSFRIEARAPRRIGPSRRADSDHGREIPGMMMSGTRARVRGPWRRSR